MSGADDRAVAGTPLAPAAAPLLRQPWDAQGPVFREPWEASAFALAVRLSEAGHFTWKEWAAALAQEIRAAAAAGDPDRGDTYYHHWLAALEKLVLARGLTSAEQLVERKQAWREAALHAPHGEPIELERAARARAPRSGD